jgi:hypothetical protein
MMVRKKHLSGPLVLWAADERSVEAEKYQLNYVRETATIVTSVLPFYYTP